MSLEPIRDFIGASGYHQQNREPPGRCAGPPDLAGKLEMRLVDLLQSLGTFLEPIGRPRHDALDLD